MKDDSKQENAPVRRFRHEAMTTTWELFLPQEEGMDDDTATHEVFSEIDQLEVELTRFRPDSDIGRLNSLSAGQSTRIGHAAMDCLLLARDVHAATVGAFDVTIGPLHACWITPDGAPRAPDPEEIKEAAACCGIEHLTLDVDALRAGVLVDHMCIDLGGIGKGYALDQVAERLKHALGRTNFLLNAGSSTVLAAGPGPDGNGWPVLAGHATTPITLRDEAVSGSGVAVKGNHIIDPRTRKPAQIARRDHAWARTPLASVADAFSTAFLILSPEEIAEVCRKHPEIALLSAE